MPGWYETIQSETEQNNANEEAPPGVWSLLKNKLSPVERIPQSNPDVIVQSLEDHNGLYYILKNQEEKTYLRITPTQYHIWQQINGENSVQDLIVDHFMESGSFAHNMVNRFVDDLASAHMLTETPVWAWQEVKGAVEKRSLFYKISSPARFILTQKLAINNLDGFISAIYRSVGWIFFTKPMQLLYLVLSIAGFWAYTRVFGNPSYSFFREGYIQGIALIWIAMIFPVLIHELGHALTVKHFDREVPKGGLMLYFGMPAAFVDTTDIWMEPRRARLAVTWNGPYTGLILGGTLSLVMYFFPDFPLNSFFFKMAFYAYLTVIFNVNPLLKYDGYYILSDALGINSLRERSMAFLRMGLMRKILDRRKFLREEWIFAIYGVLSILWTAYAIKLISDLWNLRVREGLRVLFGDGYSTLQRAMSVVLAAGVISLAVLLIIALVRLIGQIVRKHNQSGGLTRHNRLAVNLAILAVAIGIAAPHLLKNWTLVAGFVIALSAAYLLWQFTEDYQGSIRGNALRLIAASILIIGILESTLSLIGSDSIAGIRWAGAGFLISAMVLLLGRSIRTMKMLVLILGPAAGAGAFFILGFFGLSIGIQISAGIIIWLSLWNIFSLVGGARGPAVLLLGSGALLWLISWEAMPVSDLFLPGTLQLTAMGLLAGGALHWTYAQLPGLSIDEANVETARTKEAVRLAVAAVVRRVIAQVFFESGWTGVRDLGTEFTDAMRKKGLQLRIDGNKFFDDEFPNRTVIVLTELYQIAFSELHSILCRDLGAAMGTLTFNYGIDRLPWQNREVIFELILSRCAWSTRLTDQHQDEKKQLIAFLKRVPLFVTMNDSDLSQIANALETEIFAAGDELMHEGDPGEKFYIIERGQVSFWQLDEFGEDARVATKGAGQFFGEIALVSNAPRNATVRAETPLSTLTLTKSNFDELIRDLVPQHARNANIVRRSWLLRSMPIFDELESHELDWIAVNMDLQTIGKDEVLFREGDEGDRFYIVESGELIISTQQENRVVEISRCKSGEYVGEIALLQQQPRTATITAAEDSTLLSLDGEEFLDLISGYSSLGKSVTHTSSRRISYLERLDQ